MFSPEYEMFIMMHILILAVQVDAHCFDNFFHPDYNFDNSFFYYYEF